MAFRDSFKLPKIGRQRNCDVPLKDRILFSGCFLRLFHILNMFFSDMENFEYQPFDSMLFLFLLKQLVILRLQGTSKRWKRTVMKPRYQRSASSILKTCGRKARAIWSAKQSRPKTATFFPQIIEINVFSNGVKSIAGILQV